MFKSVARTAVKRVRTETRFACDHGSVQRMWIIWTTHHAKREFMKPHRRFNCGRLAFQNGRGTFEHFNNNIHL